MGEGGWRLGGRRLSAQPRVMRRMGGIIEGLGGRFCPLCLPVTPASIGETAGHDASKWLLGCEILRELTDLVRLVAAP